MSVLTPEEQAALKEMEADYKKPAVAPKPGAKVRPERFSDFAPGMSDDGKLFVIPPPKKP